MFKLAFILTAFSFLCFPSTSHSESRCSRADYIFQNGIGCIMNVRKGEWVTIIAQYNERRRIDPNDWARVTVPGYKNRITLRHGERKIIKFLATSKRIEAHYYINAYDDEDHITIEGFTTRANLQMLNAVMDDETGDVDLIYGVEPGEKFIPVQARVCTELWYGQNNQRTTLATERCIPQCVDKSSCMVREKIKRNQRPPMKIGENQLIAFIDPHNHFPETTGKDNKVINTITDFLQEDVRHILRNKGMPIAAKVQDVWFNNPERAVSSKKGLDFDKEGRFLRTDIIDIDWIIANEPLLYGFNAILDGYKKKKPFKRGERLDRLRENIKRMSAKNIGRDIFPVSDLSKVGEELLKQSVVNQPTNIGNPVTDVYAAIGRVGVRAIPIGTARRLSTNRFEVILTGVGVVIFDPFDFKGDQPLGCWARWNIGPEPVPYITRCLGNKDFRYYRLIKKIGGDYINQSNVKQFQFPKPTRPFIVDLN